MNSVLSGAARSTLAPPARAGVCGAVEGYVLGKLPFDYGFAKSALPPLRAENANEANYI